MAQQIHHATTGDTTRCRKCRFWFDRCCHGLALLEGGNILPNECHHFVTEHAPPHRLMEVSP
ncbi:MAG: hypothetical protein ACM31D_05930 [Bacteroidota bacterium]